MQHQPNCKPTALRVKFDGIPTELRALPQWVAWVYRLQGERWKKVPLDPRTRKNASTTDPTTWASFDLAYHFYFKYAVDGVGFVFAEAGGHGGIDLDKCRAPISGEVSWWAQEIVDRVATYTEVSPSGTGVKLFLRGRMPEGRGRRNANIELYSSGRFFTVTGRRLEGCPTAVEARQESFAWLIEYAEERGRRRTPDGDVIARGRTGACGEKFARLWAGNVEGYHSPSEADLALCGYLVHLLGDEADFHRVEQLFGQSALGEREKWGRDDYRERTVLTALRNRAEFGEKPPADSPLLTRKNQDYSDHSGKIYTGEPASRTQLISSLISGPPCRQAVDLPG